MLRSHEKSANESVDRTESALDPAERSLGEQSKKVLRDVRDLGAIAVESVGRSVNRLKDRGRGVVKNGRERATRVQDTFSNYVAEHPTRSLLIALGIGTLLGIIVRRRAASPRPVQDAV
jgi:ElaB/YqjD/DUF883 family membrane-anchored ribosome-binding protein